MRAILIALLLMTILAYGCSSGGGGIDPVQPGEKDTVISKSHSMLGLWQFSVDPAGQNIDVIPLRSSEMHLNALLFLEGPPLVYLTLESLEFNGNIIEAGIGLRHPFLGLTEFSGFDVCGILISNGSVSGFDDAALMMTGEGDTRLLNPDALSRWWNPMEFPYDGTMFGYKDGVLGVPDSIADFNCTLNGGKYYCDELAENDPISNVDPTGRGVFTAGQMNVRHFTIEMGGGGLVFNYAVDASWQFPNGDPPWTLPDDFPAEANRSEAWNIAVTEISNTLFNDGNTSGGELHLSIDVYDWFNAELNAVLVEAPGSFASVSNAVPSGGGAGYSTYTIDITGATPAASGDMDLLVSVICEEPDFQGFIGGTNTTAYFLHTTTVSDQPVDYIQVTVPNGSESWAAGSQHDITWNSMGSTSDVEIEYSKDGFVSDVNSIVASTPNDGSFTWTVPSDPTTTARVRITDVLDAGITDDSDADFAITMQAIYVDDSNTSGTENGSMSNPYNTIQEGLAAASAGYYVLVDDSGNNYAGPITLVSDVILKSQNWDSSDGGDMAIISATGTTVTGANDATIDGFKIQDGTAYGIRINGVDTTVQNCWVYDVKSGGTTTGIRVDNSTGTVIQDTEISEIEITSSYGNVYGVLLSTSPITISGCFIHDVYSYDNYHTTIGLYASNCAPVGTDVLTIKQNKIYNTYSTGMLGGSYTAVHGMYVTASADTVVSNNIVNFVRGGNYNESWGIRINASDDVSFVNNVVYDILKQYYYGSARGLQITSCLNFDGRNNIIFHVNAPGYFQSDYGVLVSSSTVTWEYNDVYDCGVSYNGLAPGIGCISANPLFVDPVNPPEDFGLDTGSPCIDTGDPDSSYDDDDGTRNDMGAYGGPEGNW